MRKLDVMDEIRRALRRRGIDPKTRIDPGLVLRRRLAVELSRRVPYDVATVDRVLELASQADLREPLEFLRRCSSLGLDPVAVLNAARSGLPLEQRFGERRPPVVWTFRLRRSRGWLIGAWIGLLVALFVFGGALREGSAIDVALSVFLVLGASLAIHVETRRLP